MSQKSNRRTFLRGSLLLSASTIPYFLTGQRSWGQQSESKNDRPNVGAIGVGGQGSGIANRAREFGEIAAVCDVDTGRAESAAQRLSGGKAAVSTDYRRLLDRTDISVVTIGTPDHWHSKIAIEALLAGKDVYCEKPLTLTIEEGQRICNAVKKTGRIFQVGTQQRSEGPFAKAIAMVRDNRIGKIQKITVAIGGAPKGGPFAKTTPPDHLNWDFWLGQAPKVDYIQQRSHHDFRWWYEYSGGKMTDWGAHHVDIAHWALDAHNTGPVRIEGTAEHPVLLKKGHPTADDQFNTALSFQVTCKFASGAELLICDQCEEFDNGVLLEGELGRIFVNRGKLTGKPVEELNDRPLPEDAITKLMGGRRHGHHMRNFFECLKAREQPISDVFSHHRAITTCHLANIAIRLGKPIQWDPESEKIVGDDEAAGWVRREQRKGYEIPS